MKPHPAQVWLPFSFSIVLSAIAMVTYVGTGLSGAWIPTFICFLPLSFWFAAASNQQTRAHVQSLESRIRQLESGNAPS